MKIWNKITNEPWATTSDTLQNIINIARRQNSSPEVIAAQLGRKLQNTYAVSVRDNVAVIMRITVIGFVEFVVHNAPIVRQQNQTIDTVNYSFSITYT